MLVVQPFKLSKPTSSKTASPLSKYNKMQFSIITSAALALAVSVAAFPAATTNEKRASAGIYFCTVSLNVLATNEQYLTSHRIKDLEALVNMLWNHSILAVRTLPPFSFGLSAGLYVNIHC